MITRRSFIKYGTLAGAGMLLPPRLIQQALAQNQTALPGSAIPKFVDPLPLLSVAGGQMETVIAGSAPVNLSMNEFLANVLPSTFLPATGAYTGTWVWGYRTGELAFNPAATYIGPVVVASRGTPTEMQFINNLSAATNVTAWSDATDRTLHWADPLNGEANQCMHDIVPGQAPAGVCATTYNGPIPLVPHLHGGEVPPVLDGGPNAWFTADGSYHGHAFYSSDGARSNYAVNRYPNSQEASMIWFHDHALGITRLNVYAGLAGAYVIQDPNMVLPTGLHPLGLQQGATGPVDYIIPMVIQDRMFDTMGQLFFPNIGINPEHPFWVPEFVGDTIVVNGKAWPYLDVQPRRYRFLFLNGSNARTYEMSIGGGATMWQIGTDGGYLDAPVQLGKRQKLVLMPGERADVIIDFAGAQGQTLILQNSGRTPYPKGTPPQGSTLGQIVQFRVGPGPVADASYDPAAGVPLRQPLIRLVDPAAGTLAAGVTANVTRQLTLNEVMGPGGPLSVLVNNTPFDGMSHDTTRFTGGVRPDFSPTNGDHYSEMPKEGDTEVWEIINLTADAHPIHLQLVQFQLINRQAFNVNKYNGAYNAAFPNGFVGGFGPPADYNTGATWSAVDTFGGPPVTTFMGGNPDVTPFLQGHVMPPAPNESGWKDTVQMLPGQVTRIAVRYAPTDLAVGLDPAEYHYPFDPDAGGNGYVWHCHIIDHEDNDMMRPKRVVAKANVTRTYVQGVDY